jgi:hypothetical protein
MLRQRGADFLGQREHSLAVALASAQAELPDTPIQCAFRRKAAGDSDLFQPMIPTEASR